MVRSRIAAPGWGRGKYFTRGAHRGCRSPALAAVDVGGATRGGIELHMDTGGKREVVAVAGVEIDIARPARIRRSEACLQLRDRRAHGECQAIGVVAMRDP